MTREQVNSTLAYMERLREASYEAETKAEERRMLREYNQLWKSVEPFLSEKQP